MQEAEEAPLPHEPFAALRLHRSRRESGPVLYNHPDNIRRAGEVGAHAAHRTALAAFDVHLQNAPNYQ